MLMIDVIPDLIAIRAVPRIGSTPFLVLTMDGGPVKVHLPGYGLDAVASARRWAQQLLDAADALEWSIVRPDPPATDEARGVTS